MRINLARLQSFLNQRGFTLVEIFVALALVSAGMMALLATNHYFLKANQNAESLGEHIKVRNLVGAALSEKSKGCTGAASGNLKICCADNLRGKNGNKLILPAFNLGSPKQIKDTDKIELAITMGLDPTGLKKTNIITSGEERIRDHLNYKVYLTGDYRAKSKDAGGAAIYSGAVEISAERRDLIGAPLRASVPLEFQISAAGELSSCVIRPLGQALAGNNSNTIDHCIESGGVPVPSSVGNLCRFRTPFEFGLPPMPCPPDFTGDPLSSAGCVVGTTATTARIYKIPACPAATVPGTTIVQATSRGFGNLYCQTQGTIPPPATPPAVPGTSPPSPAPGDPGFIVAPECPLDPEWDATQVPPGTPQLRWKDTEEYNPTTNIRMCKYTGTCDPAEGGEVKTLSVAEGGDGATPACVKSKPTACPYPYVQKFGTSLLTCTLPPVTPVPLAVPQCPNGFSPLPASSTDAVSWNDSYHVVCY